MSEHEWKPGDVAMVPLRSGDEISLYTSEGWVNNRFPIPVHDYNGVRPLVVIDPEDRAQVEMLRDLWDGAHAEQQGHKPSASTKGARGNALQAALREFADPKPPKPDEPTGLGAVVEDADGLRWVRHADGWWGSPQQFDTRTWAAIDAVRVLSHGVTEEDQ